MEEEKKEKRIRLALKSNNCCVNENCSICLRSMEADMGISLFLQDSFDPVCDACGKKYDWILYKLLEVYRLFEDDILGIRFIN